MHMESCHKIVKDMCIKEGAADVRFCTYRGADTAVLFFPYGINPEEHGRKTFLSGYYPISNAAYHTAKRVCAELRNRGIYAEHVTDLPARYCALKCGGHIIKNGMYSHPALGCNVHLQTVLLGDMTEEEEHADSSLFEVCCSDCGRCAEACPFGAVSDNGVDTEKCMRQHIMDSDIPVHLYPYLYQLFGCERCQLCCPEHVKTDLGAYSYDIGELILGRYNAELKDICGPNMARPMRIKKQAVILAANNGLKELLPLIESMDKTGIEKEISYAIHRLTEDI